MNSAMVQPTPAPDEFRVKRKPLSYPTLWKAAHADAPGGLSHATSSPALAPPSISRPPSYDDLYGPASEPNQSSSQLRPRTAGVTTAAPSPPPTPSPVQKAYGEARHFLGGLINHPTESNRHVTILRHSHGLVFFRGSTTSVAVSIFSDAPLPEDRTLWLQSRGWTGNTGMRAKALLNLNQSWLDVTPIMPLRADQVNSEDERAWQRDLKKFRKKAPPRVRDKHQLRETAAVRIPAETGDGYFQLVLCQGPKKKILGHSPVFRVLSTSTSSHSLRGASLSTLPLEVGAMVLGLYAETAARALATPAAAAIAAKAEPFRPSRLTRTAGQTVYSACGISDRVAATIDGTYSGTRAPFDVEQLPASCDGVLPVEAGPQMPFPMTFKARGELGPTTTSENASEISQMNITKVPDWVPEQFRGYYFGWARFDTRTGKDSSISPWCPIILSVRNIDPLQASGVNMSQIAKRVVSLRILEEAPLQSTKVEIRLMGYLRAEIPPPTGSTSRELAEAHAAAAEAEILANAYDASVVQSTLAHPSWNPQVLSPGEEQRQQSGWVGRTREGCANIQAKGHKWVGQVPLHRLGVRSAMDEWKDSQVAVSGYYIVR